jgi:hypothetical protein
MLPATALDARPASSLADGCPGSSPVTSPTAERFREPATDGDAKGGAQMFVAQGTPQTVESVRTAIVLFAAISVIFWKALLKIALTVAAIVLAVLLTSGVIWILQHVHQGG